jgi:hypothetical protein
MGRNKTQEELGLKLITPILDLNLGSKHFKAENRSKFKLFQTQARVKQELSTSSTKLSKSKTSMIKRL